MMSLRQMEGIALDLHDRVSVLERKPEPASEAASQPRTTTITERGEVRAESVGLAEYQDQFTAEGMPSWKQGHLDESGGTEAFCIPILKAEPPAAQGGLWLPTPAGLEMAVPYTLGHTTLTANALLENANYFGQLEGGEPDITNPALNQYLVVMGVTLAQAMPSVALPKKTVRYGFRVVDNQQWTAHPMKRTANGGGSLSIEFDVYEGKVALFSALFGSSEEEGGNVEVTTAYAKANKNFWICAFPFTEQTEAGGKWRWRFMLYDYNPLDWNATPAENGAPLLVLDRAFPQSHRLSLPVASVRFSLMFRIDSDNAKEVGSLVKSLRVCPLVTTPHGNLP